MPDERRMSSIIMRGDIATIHSMGLFDALHGISVFGRGVFKDKHGDNTYAGQHKDGFACGLAVLTRYDGPKVYAELGPDGSYDGRYVSRGVDVYASYGLYERGKEKAYAFVSSNDSCRYNGEDCAPDDPRLLALIAQVAPVEVRPVAPAPHPPIAAHSPPSNHPMSRLVRLAPAGARGRHGHRGATACCTPSLVAGRATRANNSRNAKRNHVVTRSVAGST